MKTRINVEELEKTIDFETVGKKLADHVESGGFKCRKTVAALLDKVRDALLKARESGAGTAALAAFLRESGIPVSEATLRQYLNAQAGNKKLRRRSAVNGADGSKPKGGTQRKPELKLETRADVKPAQCGIDERRAENPPAVRNPYAHRSGGPRIADPRNL